MDSLGTAKVEYSAPRWSQRRGPKNSAYNQFRNLWEKGSIRDPSRHITAMIMPIYRASGNGRFRGKGNLQEPPKQNRGVASEEVPLPVSYHRPVRWSMFIRDQNGRQG